MDEKIRDIAVLTGTRTEYVLPKTSMEAIQENDRLELAVIATGMHLSPKHGMTVEEIRNDGFTVDREVLMQIDGDSGVAMAKSLGIGTMGLAEAFVDLDPDPTSYCCSGIVIRRSLARLLWLI